MKKRTILYQNARMIAPNGSTVDRDMLIGPREDGKSVILAVRPHIDRKELAEKTLFTVNCDGHYLLPLFTDLSTTVREPGSMKDESLHQTTAAARMGGFCDLLVFHTCSRHSFPEEILHFLGDKGDHFHYAAPVALLDPNWERWMNANATPNRQLSLLPEVSDASVAELVPDQGRRLADLKGLAERCACFTDVYLPDLSDRLLWDAMEFCAANDRLFIGAADGGMLSGRGVMNRGLLARMQGMKGIPGAAEDLSVARHLLFAGETGCRLHLSGVSRAASLAMIREAKAKGLAVTCDVSPFHFALNENHVAYYGNRPKFSPPLRRDEDCQAVAEALADGTVDAIASHHRPYEDKTMNRPPEQMPFGAISLQTAFSAAVTYLLRKGKLDMARLVHLFTEGPHRILDPKGEKKSYTHALLPGESADFVLASVEHTLPGSELPFPGNAHNTPFRKMTLSGKILRTVLNGEEKRN